jgi:hypothetical protein
MAKPPRVEAREAEREAREAEREARRPGDVAWGGLGPSVRPRDVRIGGERVRRPPVYVEADTGPGGVVLPAREEVVPRGDRPDPFVDLGRNRFSLDLPVVEADPLRTVLVARYAARYTEDVLREWIAERVERELMIMSEQPVEGPEVEVEGVEAEAEVVRQVFASDSGASGEGLS